MPPGARCFRPCAEPATLPLTPSVAALRQPGPRAESRDYGTARPGFPRRLVKDDGCRRTRAPSIERVLPPPVVCRAFAWLTWDLEEPATGVAARVLVALATATRLPARFHPSCCRAFIAHHRRGLDPWPFGWTERRSSTSATNTAREHTFESPDFRLGVGRPRRGETASSRRRARPKPRSTTGATSFENGWRRLVTPALAPYSGGPLSAPLRAARTRRHQPRFHGPGAGMLGCQPHLRASARTVSRAQPSAHGYPRAVALTGGREMPLPQPDSLGHLSS